ncbi:DinB family protein [Fictibacillus iocasae]|uniref:DinB family protein n=1 Tax=Fictibacillus iocasae TaxID=2715437 RepID=A0ABW2NUA2_9BACL
MNFNLKEAIEVLKRTPQTLDYFLSGLSDSWLQADEGEGTWNAAEVIDHLIECEKTNFIPRIEAILQEGGPHRFPPFDRFAHITNKTDEPFHIRVLEFKNLRAANLEKLQSLVDSEDHFERTGIHPEFGEVKLRELLSTWVVHDLTHISQITRIMAKHYEQDIGHWRQYIRFFNN